MLVDLFSSLVCYLSVHWVFGLVSPMDEAASTASPFEDSTSGQPVTARCDQDRSDRLSSTARCDQDPRDRQSPTEHRDEVPSDCHTPAARSNVWAQLGSPRHILAPMVDASELPWRLLSRRYGAQLCYTPMVAAHQFVVDKKLRAEILQSTPEDRPLIVQFCGNDATNLTQAAKLAEPHCDGIDINIGCPQLVAKRGHYGAYLQDKWPLLTELVSALRATVRVPISCKIRIYPDVARTVEYALMLERAGCQLLAVHGRTVDQRGMNTGLASWDHISAVVQALSIPVIANGNIQCSTDVDRCLAETGAAGVMTAEGNLYNPALFTGHLRPAWELASEYLDLVDLHPVKLLYARGHVFNMCHHLLILPENHDIRFLVGKTNYMEDLRKAVNQLRDRFLDYHEGRKVWTPNTNNNTSCNYNIKLPPWICQPYVRPTSEERESKIREKPLEEKVRGFSVARLKKKRKLEAQENAIKRKKPDLCTYTKKKCSNPRGQTCGFHLCRTCCKDFCVTQQKDCLAHKHFTSKALRIQHENKFKMFKQSSDDNVQNETSKTVDGQMEVTGDFKPEVSTGVASEVTADVGFRVTNNFGSEVTI